MKPKKRSNKPNRHWPANRYTGRPRKWVCHNHGYYDMVLEAVEVLQNVRRLKNPPKLTNEQRGDLISHAEYFLKHMTKAMAAPELTEAELRYCELEGIEPADFLRAKTA